MSRVLIHVEGETEETFVNEVLAPYLYAVGFQKVGARLMGNARQRDRRGGVRGWESVRRDVTKHLKEDPGCLATTMVDYYGLPASGERAWPGRLAAQGFSFAQKAVTVEQALSEEIKVSMGDDFDGGRFIPYVMMHEFEGLLFSDCERFSSGIGQPELASQFLQIRNQFRTPEDINDSPMTAPSKRIEALVQGYQKPLLGNLAALEIGLGPIRAECPHFSQWLDRIEAWHLGATTT